MKESEEFEKALLIFLTMSLETLDCKFLHSWYTNKEILPCNILGITFDFLEIN